MQLDDDLELAAALKAKYEQEQLRAQSIAASDPGSEEARIEQQRQLMAARAEDLVDGGSRRSQRLLFSREARIVAAIHAALGAFLLIYGWVLHLEPGPRLQPAPTVRTLVVVAGEGAFSRHNFVAPESLGARESDLRSWVVQFSRESPVPSITVLIVLGSARLLLSIGVFLRSATCYGLLGMGSLLDALAIVVHLLSTAGLLGGEGALHPAVAMNWAAIFLYLAVRLMTAFVFISDATQAENFWRAVWWWS